MADTLLLQFNPAQPEHATWSLVNAQGELTSRITQGSLTDATTIAASHKVIVLLNSSCLHFNKVSLPTQNRQKMLRALPYALEEQIADDIDDFHLVAGKPGENEKIPVVGIKKETLDRIIAILDEAAIKVDVIIPDALCLTAGPTQWAVLFHGEHAYAQFDTLHGGLFDRDMLPILLDSIFKQESENLPERIFLFLVDNETTDELSGTIPDEVEIVNVSYNTHPLVVFCGQYKNALPLNLLQDAYKPTRKSNVKWQRWALAASLAVIWLCLHLGTTAVKYFDLKDKNEQALAQITKIYKKTFPKSKRIVNARVQMEQKLKELKGGKGGANGSIIDLLRDSATALSKDKGVTIQSISYRNNRMDINISSANLQSIESLNKSLNNNAKLNSEITSSSSEKNQVTGSIRLQKAKS